MIKIKRINLQPQQLYQPTKKQLRIKMKRTNLKQTIVEVQVDVKKRKRRKKKIKVRKFQKTRKFQTPMVEIQTLMKKNQTPMKEIQTSILKNLHVHQQNNNLKTHQPQNNLQLHQQQKI